MLKFGLQMSENFLPSNSKISLRPVVLPDDENFLIELFFSTLLEESKLWGMDDFQREILLKIQYNSQKQQYQYQFPTAQHFIVLFDGKAIGQYMKCRLEKELRGIDLSIFPEYQNLGIGKYLLQQDFEALKKEDIPYTFHVVKSNRAIKLYLRLGCVITGETVSHYQMQWKAEK
jgi:GNAT superfamily N-acetyltransferase